MRITDPENQITVHKDFDSSGQNDIALIRFNEPIPLFSDDPSKSSIAPLCLPWGENNPARYLLDSDQALVTGQVFSKWIEITPQIHNRIIKE